MSRPKNNPTWDQLEAVLDRLCPDTVDDDDDDWGEDEFTPTAERIFIPENPQ